jgi:hypothetical protein
MGGRITIEFALDAFTLQRMQMNCYTHTERAGIAVCMNCGAGICGECVQKTDTRKNVCSGHCAVASNTSDSAIAAIASRVKRSSKATAWLCWSLGAVFGVLGCILLPVNLIGALYLLPPAVIFIGTGFWQNSIAKKSI